jgi:tRNA dimethylallyltransferase
MFAGGFLDEVRRLRALPGLTGDHPSMRSVGYRQVWSYLEDDGDLEAARYRALVATRQLAKRQLTWLRSENDLKIFDPLEKGVFAAISCEIEDFLRVVTKS